MNKDKLIALAILVITIVGSFWFFTSRDQQPESPRLNPEPTIIDRPVTKTDSVMEESYMSGCLEETGVGTVWVEYCQCTYDYIDDRLTNEEFFDMALEYDENGEIPEIVVEAIESCLN